jgi:hypothetical protein
MNLDGQDTSRIIKVGEEPAIPSSPKKSITLAKSATSKAEAKARAGRRFAAVNGFVDATMRTLSRSEINIWLLLWRDTKPEGLARTAQTDLASRAGMTTRTVERAIKGLQHRGLLTVVHRGGLRKGPSSYRVHPLTDDRPPPSRPP